MEHNVTLSKEPMLFGWLDYSMFCSMLLVSTIIGIYFGCFGSRQRTKAEYLLGNKNMSIFPIAMSLTASHISGITLLGAPSEMYTYGTQYWMMCLSACIVCIIVGVAYMPVFYKLQLTSTYEGGLKAVVWTDTLQQIIMMISSVVVMILGIVAVGGLDSMWQRNLDGDRIEFFNMDPNPLLRNSFWTVTIGMTFIWMAHCGVNQGMMQRFLALPSLTSARWSLFIFCIGIFWCKTVSCLTGLLIHAQYHDCDPLLTKAIKRSDQLLPYYVMDVASHIPGLPGLFVAGVFCAALSSMSTGLNTLSGVIFEDFLSPILPEKRKTEGWASFIMKITVCIVGIICVLLVFLIERMGNVIQVSVTLGGITYGAMLGIFTLGMFFPWANTKGALVGGITSLLFVGWLVTGAQAAVSRGAIKFPKKPVSTAGCLIANVTEAVVAATVGNMTQALPLSMEADSILFLCLRNASVYIIQLSESEGAMELKEMVTKETPLLFNWLDYCMFISMLAISTAIGIYFGCFGSRQRTKAEYLLGNKNMKIFPIAMSITASHVSGITLLGGPSEMYTYGTQYWVMLLAAGLVCVVVSTAFLPVFYKLQLTSTYEYLQLRFSSSVRLVASFLFTLSQVLYMPMIVYVPALAFSQVSGINLHLITPVGGLKAVVWTDTLQQIIMMASTIVVIILGVISIGGLDIMWQRNLDGDRIEFFNMDPSPLVRNSFWTIVIGMTFITMSHYGVDQSMMQRFLALPNLSSARWLVFINFLPWDFLVQICELSYWAANICTAINRADQLVPYYVLDIASHIPGLPGLFIAGVFCAALSTMSTGLNTLCGIIYEDFLSRILPSSMQTEGIVNNIMKITVCIIGLVAVSLGALIGGLTSLALVGWLVTGSQAAIARGAIKFPKKPVSTSGCLFNNVTEGTLSSTIGNITQVSRTSVDSESEQPFVLFRLSYLYFNVVGCVTVITVGLLVSLLTGPNHPRDVNPDLLSPFLCKQVDWMKTCSGITMLFKIVYSLWQRNRHAKKIRAEDSPMMLNTSRANLISKILFSTCVLIATATVCLLTHKLVTNNTHAAFLLRRRLEGVGKGHSGLMDLIANVTLTVEAIETQAQKLDQELERVREKTRLLLKQRQRDALWSAIHKCVFFYGCDKRNFIPRAEGKAVTKTNFTSMKSNSSQDLETKSLKDILFTKRKNFN
ncbi:hypothetical protein C0J52_14407 [Blattella germanica]|nr:hypothetical protein C0J52_14407 [Blattella germanica]